jgi:hypothetical protein
VAGTWTAPSGTSVAPSQFSLYIDGKPAVTGTSQTGSATSPLTGYGGTNISRHQAWNTFFPGQLDEVRISNTVRTAGWIATEYNNNYSPSTFFYVGDEESGSGSCGGAGSAGGTYYFHSTAVSGGYRMATTAPTGSSTMTTGNVAFISDAFSGGEVLKAGTTTAYLNVQCNNKKPTITLYYGSGSTWTSLGSYSGPSWTVTPVQLISWGTFATAGHTFAAGEQLKLEVTVSGGWGTMPNGLYWDGSYATSRVELPT